MRSIVFLIGLLGLGAAYAATTTAPLPFVEPPAGLVNYHPAQSRCAATSFTATAIAGVCQYVYGTESKYFAYPTVLYRVIWSLDLSTSAVLAQCGATDPHHRYTGDGCKVNFNPTGTTVVINGVEYYYVSAGAGGDELVDSSTQSFLATP